MNTCYLYLNKSTNKLFVSAVVHQGENYAQLANNTGFGNLPLTVMKSIAVGMVIGNSLAQNGTKLNNSVEEFADTINYTG